MTFATQFLGSAFVYGDTVKSAITTVTGYGIMDNSIHSTWKS